MAFSPDDIPVTDKTTSTATSSPARNWLLPIIGFILFLPAAFSCYATQLTPSLQTWAMSQQNISLLSSKEPEFVGFDNYARLGEDRSFNSVLGFTGILVFERILAVSILPIVLALAAHALGRIIRIGTRVLFTIPLAFFAPVFIYLSWRLALANPMMQQANLLADVQSARVTLAYIDGLVTFGLACGFGLIAYMMALRRSEQGEQRPPNQIMAVLIVWLISLFTAIASALQSFALSYVLTNGGPARSTTSVMLYFYSASFQTMRFGLGSAVATMILAVLAVLGVIVGIAIIAFGVRIQTVSGARADSSGSSSNLKVLAGLVLVIGLLVSIVLIWTSIAPQMAIFNGETYMPPSANRAAASLNETERPDFFQSTTMPVLTGTLIAFPIVLLGSFGIGALRPLGRYSEWLLLPFSPFLFVTTAPLSLALFNDLRQSSLLNTPQGIQAGYALLHVPMLFILTLFFKGQAYKFRALPEPRGLGDFVRIVILPAVPLVLVLLFVAVIIGQQDIIWPLLSTTSPELRTVPVWLLMLFGQFGTRGDMLSTALRDYGLPLVLISFTVMALFQIFYIERLTLTTSDGNEKTDL